ncbi:ClpP/crotonase-like domain-containing protein [Boletus edulis]|uniref:ClpP/crotonase-like domain-containing protein n=1 Tax=Boletus edulis BED1 TaxID=1328754 RepID=A0AAD4GCV4_BOLED|nr:ClpP/crotonase-like domain-containing protein [Boletus edulis]KAF8435821.1 ClpP/crotonase-like domain-containing protein [Boletus edulis BED1]
MNLSSQVPPHSDQLKVEFPLEHVLLLTLNRPDRLNAVSRQLNSDLTSVLRWFDEEPRLWIVVITGQGRAFCAGADLNVWQQDQMQGRITEQESVASSLHGFAAISRRHTSYKPIIAAVNGSAYGGGVELVLNCDVVIASEDAVFALPEVKRGVLAVQGVIPRLAKAAGHQLASEMLLLGNPVSAVQARDRFRFVNAVVEPSNVLSTALDVARQITLNSPDSVQSTKEGLMLAQKHHFEEAVRTHSLSLVSKRLYNGENVKEGLAAFVEKRRPTWRNPSKL